MVECRSLPTAPTVRWVFVRHLQTAAVAAGMNDLITNADNHSTSFGASGNNVRVVRHDLSGNYYCGHNHAVAETDWGDGFSIGTTSATGDMTVDAIYTYRIR
jgi:hypothetical protein